MLFHHPPTKPARPSNVEAAPAIGRCPRASTSSIPLADSFANSWSLPTSRAGLQGERHHGLPEPCKNDGCGGRFLIHLGECKRCGGRFLIHLGECKNDGCGGRFLIHLGEWFMGESK